MTLNEENSKCHNFLALEKGRRIWPIDSTSLLNASLTSHSPNNFFFLPVLVQLLMPAAGPFTISHLGLLALSRTHHQPIVSFLLSSPPN